MDLHEYQSKTLFAEYGIPVPDGHVVSTSAEAREAATTLGGELWVIKAQVHAGGRGKAGGVKLAQDKTEALVEAKKSKGLYSLSEPQVIAILELRLQKLTALGINEIEVEIKKLAELIARYKKIISSKKELLKVISEELKNIKEKFAVPRRTKIIDAVLNYDIEETIQKQSVIITVTLQGYIKRGSLNNVKTQKRGGKGKTGITTRDEDFVVQIFTANTHTPMLFFSTQGLVYKIKAYKIPEGTSASKGKSIFNILPLKSHHSISSIMPLPEDENEWKNLKIIFVTSKGNIRKNSLEDFVNINASGKIAMKLSDNDKIIGVKICNEDQDILLSSKYGKCIRFKSNKLRLFTYFYTYNFIII